MSVSSHRTRRPRHRSILPLLGAVLLLGAVFGMLVGYAAGSGSAAASESPQTESVLNIGTQSAEPAFSGTEIPSEEPNGAVIAETEWNMVLVNALNPLSEDFETPELTILRNGHAIDRRAYPALQAMMDAARAEGLEPLICSSFRTAEDQERLFRNKVQTYLERGYSEEEAEDAASIWVARPGTSEHQLGLAVDIVDLSYQHLDEGQERTAVQKWLIEHCAEYGFILRYPNDKSDITGISYEPWHYRYVGTDAAQVIMENGWCLEEYLQQSGA